MKVSDTGEGLSFQPFAMFTRSNLNFAIILSTASDQGGTSIFA